MMAKGGSALIIALACTMEMREEMRGDKDGEGIEGRERRGKQQKTLDKIFSAIVIGCSVRDNVSCRKNSEQ
jgi:hypothetical protein